MNNRFNYQQGHDCCHGHTHVHSHAPCHCEPIVLPMKEKVYHRYHSVEQPVICPVNTRIVNHYVPRPVYYPTYSRCEENVCEGTATATNFPR